jgi:hypothetical protein
MSRETLQRIRARHISYSRYKQLHDDERPLATLTRYCVAAMTIRRELPDLAGRIEAALCL